MEGGGLVQFIMDNWKEQIHGPEILPQPNEGEIYTELWKKSYLRTQALFREDLKLGESNAWTYMEQFYQWCSQILMFSVDNAWTYEQFYKV